MDTKLNPLLVELKQQIAKRQVVVVAGAGISIAATGDVRAASWPGLLHSGVAHIETVVPTLKAGWAARQREAIDCGDIDDLLGVAEQIERKLGAPLDGEYRAWLRESVGQLAIKDRSVLDALIGLGVPVITTNYDGLLESASGLPHVTGHDPSRCERVLRGDEKAIIHLHGHFLEPASVVLGIRSYEEVLRNAPTQTLLRAIRACHTLLFVGYGAGLADPNFSAFLAWCEKAFAQSQYRHFRLGRHEDVPAMQAEHPPNQRIFVLGYGDEYSDLAPFLRSLVTDDATVARASAMAASMPSSLRERAVTDAVASYRAHVARSHRVQRVRFTDLAGRAEDRDRPPAFDRLPLFVLPKLEKRPRRKKLLETPAQQSEQSSEIKDDGSTVSTLSQVLEQNERLCLIIGGPGSGKTELGMWLLAKLCTPNESLTALPADTVPVRIEMRQFDDDTVRNSLDFDFVTYLEKTLQALSVRLEAAQIQELHQAGRLLWIFDGMDEVRQAERRERYGERILALMHGSPSRAIVTSRTVGCEPLVELLGQCSVYALREFDDAQIELFLNSWHALEFTDEPERAEKRRQRLAYAIEKSRSVRDLCRNPLLLTLLALLNRGDELPRRRHKVFERAVDLMVGQWDANKHLSLDSGPSAFEREDKLQFVRQLAWAMQNNCWQSSQNNLIHHDDLFRFTTSFIKQQFDVDEDRAQTHARSLINDLEERNYMLAYLGNAQYGFVHKSFMEYLAAEALVRLQSSEEQTEHFIKSLDAHNRDNTGEPAWWEVLTLACGLLDDLDRAMQIVQIMQALLLRLEEYTRRALDARLRYYAFAIRCLAEVRRPQQEPIRSFSLELMRLFHQDTLNVFRAKRGFWLSEDIIEALRIFGPRWPDSQAWLQWALKDDWKADDLFGRGHIQGIVYQCALASTSQAERVSVLTALLKQEDNGFSAKKAIDEAHLMGPWTHEEPLALARALDSASEDVLVQVGCHLAGATSPSTVRLLLQSPLNERIKLYLARDSLRSADQELNVLAIRTLHELNTSAEVRIRELSARWLNPDGLVYQSVIERLKSLATNDPSDRVRYSAAIALTYTKERGWATQQLLKLQHSQDPVVLAWLAAAIETLPLYRSTARRIWLQFTNSDDRFRLAEALCHLAKFHLDDEIKAIIMRSIHETPELASAQTLQFSLLFEVNDADVTKKLLDSILNLQSYDYFHSAVVAFSKEHAQQSSFINNYLRNLLAENLDERKRYFIARALYHSEQDSKAWDELIALSRDAISIVIRKEAADVVMNLPSTLALARSAADAEVRLAAVRTLCWRATQNDSLHPALLEITRGDDIPPVRLEAARWVLANDQTSLQQATALQVIHELARQSTDEDVQLEAAQQLALRPVLVHLAEAARDEKIRQGAADTLAWLDIRSAMLKIGVHPQSAAQLA